MGLLDSSVCLSRPWLAVLRTASSRGWCLAPQFQISQGLSATLCDLSCRTPSQSRPLRSTFWHSSLCIFVPGTCTSLDGPAFDKSDETLPGAVAGVTSSCRNTSLKISLVNPFVSSSHALMSSALISLLSSAVPLLRLSMAACTSCSVNSGIFFNSASP